MIRLITLILFISSPLVSLAQEKCSCPKGLLDMEDRAGTSADKVFALSNGKTIGMCGFEDDDGKSDTTYSGLVLFNCATQKVISRWGTFQTCRVKMVADSVIVIEIAGLPLGQDFTYSLTPIKNSKFYYVNNKLKQENTKGNFRKYSTSEIEICLSKYAAIKKGDQLQAVEVASMLFCAYISGSKKAEQYLLTIPKKFGPFDGHIGEDWANLWELYLSYKKQLD